MRIVSASTPAQLVAAALVVLTILMTACEKQDGVRPNKGNCHSHQPTTTTPTTNPDDTTATRTDSTGRTVQPTATAEVANTDSDSPGLYRRALSLLTAPEA